MLKVERISVMNFENAIRGARNPLNSWDRMDSYYDEKGNYRPARHEEEVIETTAEEKIADNKMTEGAALKDESDKAEKAEKKPRLFGKKDKKD